MKRMPANHNKKRVSSSLGDKDKTYLQWALLSMEVLRLKCNQYSLVADGQKVALQQRLIAHFKENPEYESSAPESTTLSTKAATSNTEILTELQHLRNEITTLKSNFHHHQQQMTVETDRSGCSATTRFLLPEHLEIRVNFTWSQKQR